MQKQVHAIGKNVHIHLALDTGMTRIGYADIPEKCDKDRKNLKNPESGDRGNVYPFCQGG